MNKNEVEVVEIRNIVNPDDPKLSDIGRRFCEVMKDYPIKINCEMGFRWLAQSDEVVDDLPIWGILEDRDGNKVELSCCDGNRSISGIDGVEVCLPIDRRDRKRFPLRFSLQPAQFIA